MRYSGEQCLIIVVSLTNFARLVAPLARDGFRHTSFTRLVEPSGSTGKLVEAGPGAGEWAANGIDPTQFCGRLAEFGDPFQLLFPPRGRRPGQQPGLGV